MFIVGKNKFQRVLRYSVIAMVIQSIPNIVFANCANDPALQKLRSQELQKLKNADQEDRKVMLTDLEAKGIDTKKMIANDLARRKRVGEIFAEGCISTPKDYATAALIYQHGDVPDHFYQAYIWFSKESENGNAVDRFNGREGAVVAIDRYLISIGKKQLFGSQMCIAKTVQNKPCFSLKAIEPSFPDNIRKSYSGFTLEEKISMYRNTFKKYEYCPNKCEEILKPTPKESVPGLW